MFKQFAPLSALALALFTLNAQADDAINKAITSKLSQYEINVEEVQPTPVTGVYEVQTKSGILYTTKDASHFFYGNLFEAKPNQIINLTEKTQAKRNIALFNKADVEKELIVYPAKDEKFVVNVFTDTSCGFCVKLHNDIKKYNDLGITVRYLAFPRSGERSPNLGLMSAVWCAKDKREAMDLAKEGKFKETNASCMSTVRKQYELGLNVGVTGTPAIMMQNGTLLSGYMQAPKLLARLQQG